MTGLKFGSGSIQASRMAVSSCWGRGRGRARVRERGDWIRGGSVRRSYLEDVGELTLAVPVLVHDDPVGLAATFTLVEHDQMLFDLGDRV